MITLDVTTSTTTSTPGTTLTTLLKGLCNKSGQVKSDICSALSKTGFSDVIATDIYGRGKNAVTKQYLTENIITFIRLIDCIDPIINADPPVFDLTDDVTASNDHKQYMGDIKNRLDRFETTIKCNNNNIMVMLDKLAQLQSTTAEPLPATPYQSPVYPARAPSLIDVENPTTHIQNYVDGYITADQESELLKFLGKQTFGDVKSRHVIDYGSEYKYTGSPANKGASSPIPDIFSSVIEKITGDYPGCDINQCTVNRYLPASHLPEHSDNERTIKPESNIFTVSLGASRDIIFKDITTRSEKVVTTAGCSMYAMSQPSQSMWTHRMEADASGVEDIRYSLTFRCVGSNYANSCIVLGDSNTKHLSFGTGRGNFGWALPGKRVNTPHIHDIDPTSCLGYQVIVLHVGINDMRNHSIGRVPEDPAPHDVHAHIHNLMNKITAIEKLCPKSRIIVACILPTKSVELNNRAGQFNGLMREYVMAHKQQIKIIDANNFCNQHNMLDGRLAVYDRPGDQVHLGYLGIRLLCRNIKAGVLTRHVDHRGYSMVASSHSDSTWPPLRPVRS